jgi:hypothetical protein
MKKNEKKKRKLGIPVQRLAIFECEKEGNISSDSKVKR